MTKWVHPEEIAKQLKPRAKTFKEGFGAKYLKMFKWTPMITFLQGELSVWPALIALPSSSIAFSFSDFSVTQSLT